MNSLKSIFSAFEILFSGWHASNLSSNFLGFRLDVNCVTSVGASRSKALVASVLVAVGWKWVLDTNHCNPGRGYWLAWHCSSRFFWCLGPEEAEQNHRYNLEPSIFFFDVDF